MKTEDLEILRILVQSRSGVVIDPTKTYLIESRLGPVARREGFASLSDLVTALRTRREERLMWAVTEALTDTDTSFFRDSSVFDEFRDAILPRFAGPRTTPIRIWSAACASGQEPFSLAMALEDERSRLGGARVELFASDLSEACLEKAQSGLYTQFEVQRGLPIRLLVRHFERHGEMWRIAPTLAQAVRFRRINLLADLSALGSFEVIFCRYAVSQFEPGVRRRVLAQLAGLLSDDGVLVLGRDENIDGVDGLVGIPGHGGLFTRPAQPRESAAA
jgi:chemotaxis protein methyltransferase CheR